MKNFFLLSILLLFSLFSVAQNIKHSKIDLVPSSSSQTINIAVGDDEQSESKSSTKPQPPKQSKSPLKKEKETVVTNQNQQKQSPSYSLTVSETNGQYWAPISVNSTEYRIGFTLQDDMPSWIFTSLTDKHQLCDLDNNCDEADEEIRCKKNKMCNEQKQSSISYKSEKVKGAKSLILTFKNEDQQISELFVSPEKVKIGDGYDSIEELTGMLNLNKKIFKFENGRIVIESTLLEKPTIKLSELVDKTIQIRSKDDGDPKSMKFSSIKLTFQQNQIMSVPPQIYSQILRILKEDHFKQGKCKMYSSSFKCKKTIQIDKTAKIDICLSKKCFKVNVNKLVEVDSSSSKKINILLHKSQNDDILFSPAISQFLELFVDNGVVQGLKFEDSSPKTSNDQKEESQKQSDEEQQEEQQSEKEEEQNEKKSEDQESQKEQDEDQKEDEDESQESQQEEKEEAKKEKKKKKEQSTKAKHLKSNKQDTIVEQKSEDYSRGLLSTFLIYGGIALLIIIVIKMKAQESIAAAVIDNCLDKTWYRIMDKYFKNSKGYNPTKYNEHEEEQIDHDDTVAVGYTQTQGRQLFWERNSVQGI